jgi:hypothetical protein
MEINTSTTNATKVDITKLRYYNELGEKKYDVDKISTYMEKRDGKGLIRDICMLLGEERVNF